MPAAATAACSLGSNTTAMREPNTAIASTPATRDSALLTPEAVPASSAATDCMTVVVKGATAMAMPRPSTATPGRKPLQ